MRNDGAKLAESTVAHTWFIVAAMLSHAGRRGVIDRSPMRADEVRQRRGRIRRRERVLSEAEMKQLTATGYVLGTPAYMAPEQITDQAVDRRTDVYALGLILFEMLTGQQVFTGSNPTSVIFKHVSEPPPVPSSVASHLTPEIDAVVLKALAKSPDDRYETAGDLATAFGLAVQSRLPSTALDDFSLHEIPGPPATHE